MSIADKVGRWPVTAHEQVADCKVFRLVTDTVAAPDGAELVRSYLDHPGAVAVIALDEQERVVVVQQYRHPMGMTLVEAPAGLLDVEGEDPLLAARRELAEEVELEADDWRVLVDKISSGGSSNESVRIFLARGLRPAARPEGFAVAGEEAHMAVARVPLGELVDAALAGRIGNASLVIGVLALHTALRDGRLDELRTPDAAWRSRAATRRSGGHPR